VTGAYDRVAAVMTPNNKKSLPQQASDSIRGASDNASDQGKGMMDQAKEATSNFLGRNNKNNS
jgi:hypothetical protein